MRSTAKEVFARVGRVVVGMSSVAVAIVVSVRMKLKRKGKAATFWVAAWWIAEILEV
jgi:hypothetical protein